MSPGSPPSLRVLASGLGTTIQDLGRTGWRRWGVPRSGALDADSLRLANVVVGNDEGEAAFEVLRGELHLEVRADAVRLALASPDGYLTIEGPVPRRVPSWQSTTVGRDERVRCSAPATVACGYLVCNGGFELPAVLGSRSTYARGSFGGWDGRALRHGDVIPLRRDRPIGDVALRVPRQHPTSREPIRVIAGPHLDRLLAGALDELCVSDFVVTQAADRMGMRLTGPPVHHVAGTGEMLAWPTVPGVIQVPPDGQPIVLLPDCQTTGGYPIVAVVCSADLSRVGRLLPGDRVRFVVVPIAAARDAARDHEATVRRHLLDVQPCRDPAIGVRALYRENLVGGVVDASRTHHLRRIEDPIGPPANSRRLPCPSN